MSENVENINLLFADSQRKNLKEYNSLSQELTGVSTSKTSLKGLVQIHENTEEGSKLVTETNNLIVYPGRAMMLCRAFGKDLNYLAGGSPTFPFYGMKDKFISFFAVGTGGSASDNNQNPLVVNSTEYELNTHGTVGGATKLVTVNGRNYMGFDDSYPTFIYEPEVVNTTDIYTPMRSTLYDGYKRDSYLIAKVQVTLGASVGNDTGTQLISEAGLFLAENDDVNDVDEWWDGNGYTSNHLEMFAKVTFPTIAKTASRSFTINWYLFF
jgi:hypothetical protein